MANLRPAQVLAFCSTVARLIHWRHMAWSALANIHFEMGSGQRQSRQKRQFLGGMLLQNLAFLVAGWMRSARFGRHGGMPFYFMFDVCTVFEYRGVQYKILSCGERRWTNSGYATKVFAVNATTHLGGRYFDLNEDGKPYRFSPD